MPARDRVTFESVAGELLKTLGYETDGRTRYISLAERLAWGAHQQICWVAVRLRALRVEAFFTTFLRMTWARVQYRLRRAVA